MSPHKPIRLLLTIVMVESMISLAGDVIIVSVYMVVGHVGMVGVIIIGASVSEPHP